MKEEREKIYILSLRKNIRTCRESSSLEYRL